MSLAKDAHDIIEEGIFKESDLKDYVVSLQRLLRSFNPQVEGLDFSSNISFIGRIELKAK